MPHSRLNPFHNCARHACSNCAKSGCAANSVAWDRISRLQSGARWPGKDKHVRPHPGDRAPSHRCDRALSYHQYHRVRQHRCRLPYQRHKTRQFPHSQASRSSSCGLLRTSMFAFVFGPTQISDAYVQAFLIPDTIFNIVAGGALSSAFIPVFIKYMVEEKDEKTAWHIASSALNLAIVIMVALALIVIIFAHQIVPLYNPGATPFEINLIVSLTRIMLLQAIVLGAGVIVTSVLQARQNFLLFAIGTVLYNVGLIIGLLPGIYLAYHGRTNDIFAVYAATFGVVLGAILQVGIQVSGLLQVRMRYTFAFDWRHPGVIRIGHQMLPRIFNAAMLSATIFVDRYLLSFLSAVVTSGIVAGLITEYYQAFTILMLPLGIFGMSVSTAAFPTIAEYVARNRMDRVRSIIMETLRGILFMSIPSSIGLIVLSLPIIQV